MIKKKVSKKPVVCMSIEVPVGGIELKLTNKHTIGTLTIESNGIKFIGAKAKVKVNKVITWEVLKNLFKSGLV